MTTIEKLRQIREDKLNGKAVQKLTSKKLKRQLEEENSPEKLPDNQNKFYLVWKKHHALGHSVLRLSNGVICKECGLNFSE